MKNSVELEKVELIELDGGGFNNGGGIYTAFLPSECTAENCDSGNTFSDLICAWANGFGNFFIGHFH